MSLIQDISVIPEPVSINFSTGSFILTEKTVIYSDSRLLQVSKFLKDLIHPATSFDLETKEYKEPYNGLENSIILKLTEYDINFGIEGYLLSVNPKQVKILANTPAGIFYGLQTLRMLLPVEIEHQKLIKKIEWKIPCIEVKDVPRFSWRGYMLDEGRHFHGKETVKRVLDLMALLKLNIFHWHLTEDQGWRIEIKKYPKLTEIGSKREETHIGWRFSKKRNGIPHSGYYTQEDIQEIITFAQERFITIIPEINMPGHSKAVLASYPNISCRECPLKVSTHWGFHKDVICAGKEEVFAFIQNILNELIELFPAKIIHLGGDEVLKDRWKDCPKCQKRIKTEDLREENDLQTYFINRVAGYLQLLGIKVICWNDVLAKDLRDKIICQYWFRHKKKVIEHIKNVGNIINSDFNYTYLDHSYSFTTLKKAYKFEPIPKKLKEKYHKYVLGLEAPMWTEYVSNIKRLEWQTFPRLIAFAEIGWTPRKKKNFTSFLERLQNLLKRLDIMEVNYASSKEVKGNFFKRLFKIFTLLMEEKGGI